MEENESVSAIQKIDSSFLSSNSCGFSIIKEMEKPIKQKNILKLKRNTLPNHPTSKISLFSNHFNDKNNKEEPVFKLADKRSKTNQFSNFNPNKKDKELNQSKEKSINSSLNFNYFDEDN